MATVEPGSGRQLDRALDVGGPLSPAAGAALADDLYAELDVLHRTGEAHGGVEPEQVRLLPDGTARLAAPAARGATDRQADVQATARLVCAALGIPLRWSPTDPLRESERAAPALAATLRALAQGSLPLEPAGARAALREAAGGLVEEETHAAARAELAARAGASPAPAAQHHPPTVMLPVSLPSRRPLLIGAGIAGALIVLAGVGVLGWSTAARHPNPRSDSSAGTSPPSAQRSPSPVPLPSIPSASGPITSVLQTPQTTCEPGATCKIEVDVHFVKADAPQTVSWQFELVDGCTSEATYVQGSSVQAKKGWVHVVGDTDVALPAGHPLAIVAITTEPSHAASAPLLITSGTC